MKTLAVTVNLTKPHARDVLSRLAAKAEALGLRLTCDAATAELVDGRLEARADDALYDGVDAVIAMGGDGTMLRAARHLNGRDIPLIGVNLGSLGFLTSVAEADMERALDCLAADAYEISYRSIAESVVLRNGEPVERYFGLNDVVVSSGASSRVITLDVAVNGQPVTSFVCDGLIVSTPTGSTGHSLSAGGPIMVPGTQAFVISLICPHTLSSRPLVLPDDSVITIEDGAEAEAGLQLSVDGQVGRILERGEQVRVTAVAGGVRFIHLPGHNYFAVLRQKLGWKGSSVR